jgi:dUTP pyrophosphatase
MARKVVKHRKLKHVNQRKEIRGSGRKDGLCVKITGDLVPKYQSLLAAGCDLYAASDDEIVICPRDFCTIPTGIRVEIPVGYEAQVRPRSGLAKQYGIGVLNSPGTIDADYRGEIKVILFNYSNKPFRIKKRDRIAQLVFNRVEQARFVRVKRLRRTKRQTGGLGHTGL